MIFPAIQRIDDVLPAIEGRDEFRVIRGPHVVSVDYTFVLPDSFDCPIRRECRGIKFSPTTGEIVARPFHKFFNMGEKPETSYANVMASGIDAVMDKRDGSMVHPFRSGPDSWFFATRAGVTDHAKEAGRLAQTYPNFRDLLEWCGARGVTPIFEWTSPENRIVLRYDEPALTLLALREIVTGDYWPQEDVDVVASDFGVPAVERIPYPLTLDFCPLDVKHETGREGYVLRLYSGDMVKLKTEEYVLMHRTKDSTRSEKDVLALCLDGKVDDALSLLDEEDASRLRVYDAAVAQLVARLVSKVVDSKRFFEGATRKLFAAYVARELDPLLRGPAFKVWDGADPFGAIVASLRSVTKSNSATREAMNRLIGNTPADRGFASSFS